MGEITARAQMTKQVADTEVQSPSVFIDSTGIYVGWLESLYQKAKFIVG